MKEKRTMSQAGLFPSSYGKPNSVAKRKPFHEDRHKVPVACSRFHNNQERLKMLQTIIML